METEPLPDKTSNPIPIADFPEYVKCGKESGALETEFDTFNPPDRHLQSHDEAKLPGNLEKHRYFKHPDILLTYDHTRVILDDGFIAANWVDGYNHPKKYIATQCPKPETASDFYRMVWQYGAQEIINLASPHDMESGKGFKYYPEESVKHGEIEITLLKKETVPDVIIRRYELKNGDETRQLTHFHFQSWPDLAAPEDPNQILNLINAYRSDELYVPDKPLVIHCMAGVGRTGTFLLTDAMFDMSDQSDELDFLGHLWKIRNQRISMVEKTKQYIYAHEAVLTHLEGKGKA
jgi:protein tyrosine phosphatase